MELQQLKQAHLTQIGKGYINDETGLPTAASQHTAITLQHSIDVLRILRDKCENIFDVSHVNSELTKLTEQLQSLKK